MKHADHALVHPFGPAIRQGKATTMSPPGFRKVGAARAVIMAALPGLLGGQLSNSWAG